MTEVFVGQISTYGFAFAPRGQALCNGQVLPIAQNQALFSLLGTIYGGNGTTNFALPDLRSRTPVGAGGSVDNGWNPSPYPQGAIGGVENVTLLITQLPAHTHLLGGNSTAAASRSPAANLFGTTTAAMYSTTDQTQVALNPTTIGTAGNTQPHQNVQPYLAINFCIALLGIYPSRN